MKKGNAREFLENIDLQDAWVHYKGCFFFVNGCCEEWDRETGKTIWARIEMYELESDHGKAIADVCSITKPTVCEVMEEFVSIPLIVGKTFWELEPDLEWVKKQPKGASRCAMRPRARHGLGLPAPRARGTGKKRPPTTGMEGGGGLREPNFIRGNIPCVGEFEIPQPMRLKKEVR